MNIEADRDEIARFVAALFQHADTDTFVSLRAFRDDADGAWGYEHWSTVRINGDGFGALVDAAFALASACAAAAEAVVFAPPIATFNKADKADAGSLANGLVITVEIDADPATAREKLEAVLGPPTIAMQSGGLWIDQATGELCPKQHVHWRLAQPTRTPIEHDFLREIRGRATALAGGDASAVPMVHPLRWAGSVHRKDKPRLARIVAYNPEVEITLAAALERLRAAAAAQPAADLSFSPHRPGNSGQADALDVAAALAVLANDDLDWEQWNTIGLACWRATGGSEAGYAALAAWSSKSAKFDARTTRARWDHFATSPPDRIGAGTLFHMAREAFPGWTRPSSQAKAAQQAEEFSAWERHHPLPDPDKINPRPSAGPPENDYDTATSWAAPAAEEPWPEMDAEAFYGLAGEVVDAIAPTTEADPVAILAHYLLEVGNAIGRRPYYQHEHTRHYPNLFSVLLGRTGKSRKGTSANRISQVMALTDPEWTNNCVKSGLSSGEGIIAQIHDEIRGREKIRRNKQIEYVEVVKDPGIADKRLMILETEFAGALGAMKRDGNILSRVLRDAYDGRVLATLTKNNPMKATGGHISVIAHVTINEYRNLVDQTSLSNGFCNRFLHILVKRAQELPFGSELDERTAQRFAHATREAVDMARAWSRVDFTDEAKEQWVAGYHDLSAEKPGLFGDIVARGEAHTVRLALTYALLNRRCEIFPEHLRAALAFWRYSEASAKYIFRDYLGDPLADAILEALRQAGPDGMSRWDIYNFFGRNRSSERIGQALTLLLKHGKARMTRRSGTSGRPAEIWKAV